MNKKCNEIDETSATLLHPQDFYMQNLSTKTSPNPNCKIKKKQLLKHKTVHKPIYLCGSCKKKHTT